MGTIDVEIYSKFNELNIRSLTPELNMYNTDSDAIGVYEYDERIKNYLLRNPKTNSYRIAIVSEATIKTIAIIGESVKNITIRTNNMDLNLVRPLFSLNSSDVPENLEKITLSLAFSFLSMASQVSSMNEMMLNEKRNPIRVGDRKYILWTIHPETVEGGIVINGILVGIFQTKNEAINFYKNGEYIRNYILEWELKN
jgi:hypothetical protein